MNNIIDCKGLNCPIPVINTKKYFDSISKGEATVIVDNEVAKNNIVKFAQSNNFKSTIDKNNDLYYITINKETINSLSKETNDKKLVILITNDKLGLGDDTLGTTLMKSYLYALSESNSMPSDLMFLNAGVKLATDGSDCISSIKKLEERGVNILSCGTCLDYYNLKDKLRVGEITNMYIIVEKMNSADNSIKI
ncbi:sulfurtransferase-like selenium metabolism protein YedF [Clostridium sp. DJ247]|uniref:sulfurtransferase-like selenium metabolism protein YedF n=1 Tax=Clostridium sp. DJ247 TaxID=2726188 RepID=UPI0016244607|nr:sulfurtransferase-like selenium metabolism protein YedF [Clostridium sp. DJ247]MBC2581347.1 sulfurtransferase-like selenium metabolism protein YedF [Clostridium sp. DJ247]